MTRAEPLFAAVAAEDSRAGRLLEHVGEPEAVDLFGSLAAKVASAAPGRLGRHAGILLTEAFRAAADAGSTGSVDLMAAATEGVFDAFLLVDEALERSGSPTGVAAGEDLAWFADCGSLGSLSRDVLEPVIERSRRFTSRPAGVGLEALVRSSD